MVWVEREVQWQYVTEKEDKYHSTDKVLADSSCVRTFSVGPTVNDIFGGGILF